MFVELRPINSIKPYENNPRINDDAVDAVANSIREFGFRQPIVVDEHSVIIVGHTRYLAALKLGLEEVPVHVAVGLSPAQAKAYRIADNQTARLSDWDNDRLVDELTALQQMDFDLDLTGFSSDELAKILEQPSEGQCEPDEVPEPPDKAITQPGDLYLLGNHRLLCGDSSKAEDVDRLLDGAAVHLVNTDPPYTTCARCIPKLPKDKQMRKIPCLTMFGSKPWPFDRPSYLGGKLARCVTWLAKQLPRQCGTQAMLHSRGRSAR